VHYCNHKQTPSDKRQGASRKFPSPPAQNANHHQSQREEPNLNPHWLRKGIWHPFADCDKHDYQDKQRAEDSSNPTTGGCR
jgi:hypothetical protein